MIPSPLIVALAGLLGGIPSPSGDTSPRPNIVVILADDLGYSDLGCYGGEIQTPNLDRLAAGGLRFSQFYNTARCWPSRAALLTGYYAQQVRRDTVPGVASGGQGKRPSWAKLLPEMLKPLGYRSYHAGKWHVDGMPLANGFDHSYYVEDVGRYFQPRTLFEDDQKLTAVKPGTEYYATAAIADHGIKYLREHTEKQAGRPFFLYLAFNSPHFPLQAPQEDIARYRDRYQEGWETVRAQRWKRVQELGLVKGQLSAVEREVEPPYHFPLALEAFGPDEVNRPLEWSTLTESQRAFQATKMEIHAAMVDRLDREIGRVLDQLRAMGTFENTLIFFMSDNGASAEIMVRDNGHDPLAPPGSASTHLCLGPGWSTVANTPFRRHKTWVHEGGIATPLIAHWPKGIATRGEVRHDPGHLIDLVPTILEVAGAGDGQGSHSSNQASALLGKSLVPAFARDVALKHDDLWWAHEGNRAIRVGDWKLVAAKDESWELFNLANDRTETHDLATENTAKVGELAARWQRRMDEFTALALAGVTTTQPPTSDKPVKDLILPGESFLIEGRPAFIFAPSGDKKQTPQPWIIYAPTLPGLPDAQDKRMQEQITEAGVAVTGIDIGEAYGSPDGRRLFSALYRELVEKRGFAPKLCVLGRSRGGLMVTNWAIDNPEKVAGIAGIYPVFDLRSYPGVAKAAPAYRLPAAELEARLADFNPIARVDVLAKRRVPVCIIHGDNDKIVPIEDNSAAVLERYRTAGVADLVKLIVPKGQGHNMWGGYFHCQELIDFAIARALAGAKPGNEQ